MQEELWGDGWWGVADDGTPNGALVKVSDDVYQSASIDDRCDPNYWTERSSDIGVEVTWGSNESP